MKKLLLAYLLFSFGVPAFSQTVSPTMILKYNGFVSSSDSTKQYVVIEAPKKTKKDLFKKTSTYINSLYQSPRNVVSIVDLESITVNARTESIKGSLDWYKYPMRYNIIIEFKDEKIKFSPTVVEFSEVWSDNNPPRKYYLSNTDSPNKVEVNCIYMANKDGAGYWLFQKDLKKSFDNWVNNYISGIVNKLNEDW